MTNVAEINNIEGFIIIWMVRFDFQRRAALRTIRGPDYSVLLAILAEEPLDPLFFLVRGNPFFVSGLVHSPNLLGVTISPFFLNLSDMGRIF